MSLSVLSAHQNHFYSRSTHDPAHSVFTSPWYTGEVSNEPRPGRSTSPERPDPDPNPIPAPPSSPRPGQTSGLNQLRPGREIPKPDPDPEPSPKPDPRPGPNAIHYQIFHNPGKPMPDNEQLRDITYAAYLGKDQKQVPARSTSPDPPSPDPTPATAPPSSPHPGKSTDLALDFTNKFTGPPIPNKRILLKLRLPLVPPPQPTPPSPPPYTGPPQVTQYRPDGPPSSPPPVPKPNSPPPYTGPPEETRSGRTDVPLSPPTVSKPPSPPPYTGPPTADSGELMLPTLSTCGLRAIQAM